MQSSPSSKAAEVIFACLQNKCLSKSKGKTRKVLEIMMAVVTYESVKPFMLSVDSIFILERGILISICGGQ